VETTFMCLINEYIDNNLSSITSFNKALSVVNKVLVLLL